jgi:ribonuclease HI
MSKYYAVARGYSIGIYDDWEVTKKLVSGYPGALHKSFKTITEAENYLTSNVDSYGSGVKNNVTNINNELNEKNNRPSINNGVSSPINVNKSNLTEINKTPHNTPQNSPVKVSFHTHINNELSVYTDGSHSKGKGGIGVVFVIPGSHLGTCEIVEEISEHMPEFPTTNQRAELMAVLVALKQIQVKYSDYSVINIYTDSEYVVNTFNKFIHQWLRNNWLTSNKETPKNSDLILQISSLLKHIPQVTISWVQSHATNIYNNLADELAKNGRILA